MRIVTGLCALAAGLAVSASAGAAVFTVDALAHSSNNGAGTGLSTISVTSGQVLNVSASATDLWSAGALPRWSNADGLVGNLYATGSDESGQAASTLIGVNFGTTTQNGFTAAYGALVGQIGSGAGSYRLLGTSFNGPAWATGTLKLLYWDTNFGDNTEHVAVNIATRGGAVPEPASWAMMIAGFGLSGYLLRRRRALTAA